MVVVGAVAVGGAAAVVTVPAVVKAVSAVSMTSLNGALSAMYGVFVVWGIFSTVYAIIADEEVARVNMISYITVSTVAHYGITFGGGAVFSDLVSYPVAPESLFRALDVTVLVSASTVMVYFFSPDTLLAAPIVGSGLMTVSMTGQTYKAGTVLQGIMQGTRDDASGKLLSAME